MWLPVWVLLTARDGRTFDGDSRLIILNAEKNWTEMYNLYNSLSGPSGSDLC